MRIQQCSISRTARVRSSLLGIVYLESVLYDSLMGIAPLRPYYFPGLGLIAGVVAMLASEDGAHINGESILVDGGTLA